MNKVETECQCVPWSLSHVWRGHVSSHSGIEDWVMCSPKGLGCVKTQTRAPSHCIVSCQGLYADVVYKNNTEELLHGQDVHKFHKLLQEYYQYKNGFVNNLEFNFSSTSDQNYSKY